MIHANPKTTKVLVLNPPGIFSNLLIPSFNTKLISTYKTHILCLKKIHEQNMFFSRGYLGTTRGAGQNKLWSVVCKPTATDDFPKKTSLISYLVHFLREKRAKYRYHTKSAVMRACSERDPFCPKRKQGTKSVYKKSLFLFCCLGENNARTALIFCQSHTEFKPFETV